MDFSDNYTWVDCECCHPSHAVRFYVDPEDGLVEIEMKPIARSFFQRLKVAIMYVFGAREPWFYESTIITSDKQEQIVNLFEQAQYIAQTQGYSGSEPSE